MGRPKTPKNRINKHTIGFVMIITGLVLIFSTRASDASTQEIIAAILIVAGVTGVFHDHAKNSKR